MVKYFRVKALYPQNNMAIVADSYGKYDEIWQLSAFLISKGFKILEVWDDGKVVDSDMPKVKGKDTNHIFVRNCTKYLT